MANTSSGSGPQKGRCGMNFKNMFPGKYINAGDVDPEITVTIATIKQE